MMQRVVHPLNHLLLLRVAALSIVFVGCCWLAPACEAQSPSGRRAFERHSDVPWYDSDKDSVRFLPPPKINPAQGKQRTNTGPQNPRKGRSNRQSRSGSGIGASSGGVVAGGVVAVLFWIVVVIVLIAFAVGIIWAVIQMNSNKEDEEEQSVVEDRGPKETSVERLPFKVSQPVGDFLTSARQALGAGNYREAIIFLYSHVLVTLDQKGLIQLTRGKTNRQYLREVYRHQMVATYLEDCMIPFEKAFFGNIDLDQADVGPCFNQFDQFQQTVSNTNVVG